MSTVTAPPADPSAPSRPSDSSSAAAAAQNASAGANASITPGAALAAEPPTQGQGQVQPQAPAQAQRLAAGEFTMLSPSARTSFTRVGDTTAQGSIVDPPEEAEDDDDEPIEDDDDAPAVAPAPGEGEGDVPLTPQVALTFLLISGKRRSMTFEPETTVGRTKELVWNAWPKEWQDERPPAPSYLRILYLGKILQDEDTLTKVGFPVIPATPAGQASASAPPPTVVHLSIRAYAPPGTKDTASKKKGSRGSSSVEEPEEMQGSCCCIVC